ncbi:MAG: ABC transporter permease subunit [Ruminococcaceae bacterium]|nr:ABC transporter permease subunit [Oscillospiraceae bacterium]
MSRLLRANFSRLWKTTAFWGCLIAAAALGILMQLLEGRVSGLFRSMYNAAPVELFFAAVFAVMYIGTDNSDRTVRNKLIVGISRVKIYFANLITVSAGTALIFAADWLALIVYDLITHGGVEIEPYLLALYAALCLIAGAAMAAVCTLLATLITSKSLASTLTITLMIGMFFGGQYILSLSYSLSSDNSVMSGAVETAYNLMPTSQIEEILSRILFVNENPEVFHIGYALEPMWYSLGLCAAVTVIGALAFRKKDLR